MYCKFESQEGKPADDKETRQVQSDQPEIETEDLCWLFMVLFVLMGNLGRVHMILLLEL